jgi:hypothetical protein
VRAVAADETLPAEPETQAAAPVAAAPAPGPTALPVAPPIAPAPAAAASPVLDAQRRAAVEAAIDELARLREWLAKKVD